jgi:hypothetical protein
MRPGRRTDSSPKNTGIYMIPRRCRTMRMTATTIRTWIQLPVRGKLELSLPPKKPSSHRMNRITMIVHNMRFLLLNDVLKVTQPLDRVKIDLTIQQNEDAGCDGEDSHNYAQA